jgi:hypothetical protein
MQRPRAYTHRVWALPISLAATLGIEFLSLPEGTEMFHFPSFASPNLYIQSGDIPALPGMGYPIRTSSDQSPLSGSPGLFAANHVLHRLLAPRHPPFALSSLTINQNFIFSCQRTIEKHPLLVEVNGLEPMTSCVQGRRSPS